MCCVTPFHNKSLFVRVTPMTSWVGVGLLVVVVAAATTSPIMPQSDFDLWLRRHVTSRCLKRRCGGGDAFGRSSFCGSTAFFFSRHLRVCHRLDRLQLSCPFSGFRGAAISPSVSPVTTTSTQTQTLKPLFHYLGETSLEQPLTTLFRLLLVEKSPLFVGTVSISLQANLRKRWK